MEVIEKSIETTFYYTGIMKKPIIEMAEKEREMYYKESFEKVKESIFLDGQPLVYKKDGQFVAEYANGVIEIVE